MVKYIRLLLIKTLANPAVIILYLGSVKYSKVLFGSELKLFDE